MKPSFTSERARLPGVGMFIAAKNGCICMLRLGEGHERVRVLASGGGNETPTILHPPLKFDG